MEFSSEQQGKSYTCAFCQRGFSNAQALGGHMNIHRRDRAKLRQSFEENLLSMENSSPMKSTSTTTTIDDHELLHHHHLEEKVLFGLEYSTSSSSSGTSSSNYKKYKDDHAIIIQRGKGIGTSSSSELVGIPISPKNEVIRFESVEEKKIDDDLDLELRLGFEPQQEGPNLSTREFF